MDDTTDVMALQTAAGVELLAIDMYERCLGLPLLHRPDTNPVVADFLGTTLEQHRSALRGFNAAVSRSNGAIQRQRNPRYAKLVDRTLRRAKRLTKVIELAVTVEDIAVQTYVKDVGLVGTAELRGLFAGVAGVAAQHRAMLLTVQALLTAGHAELIGRPPNAKKLPERVGAAGFPSPFTQTQDALPPSAGTAR